MKILTTTFYADFARYFNYLEECFEAVIEDIDFYNISIYPTAHYQWKIYKRHTILLPRHIAKRKIDIRELPKEYKGVNLEEVIAFSDKTLSMFGRSNKRELVLQSIKYIDYFDILFTEEKFDLYISSGDSRMLIQIAKHFALQNNVLVYYFEQGPFGTTILDKKGVNCNISFMDRTELNTEIDIEKVQNYISGYYKNKPTNYWRNKKKDINRRIVNFQTFLWMYPIKIFSRKFPIDTQMGGYMWENLKDKIHSKLSLKQTNNLNIQLPDKYIVFIMQVPTDAQMIENSPLYNSFYEMVCDIYNAIPKGFNLVVREHPFYLGKYESKLYDFIDKNKHIYLINNASLVETIKKSQLLILNNSTVGIEALSYYKTVVTLGEAYYNRDRITYKLKNKQELNKLMQYALDNPIKDKNINIFLYNILFEYLYIGHFQDKDLQNGDLIVHNMLQSITE